jgi:4-amino-4-deoxy-L-arabinose transferase-like glycosyltransferase
MGLVEDNISGKSPFRKNNRAVSESKIPKRNTKNIIVVFILFCIVNYCYYAFSRENAAIARDTKTYIEPARLLLLEGKYESKYRLPAYPLFLAVFLLFTSNITNLVIFCQVILLFGCALIAKQITELFIKKNGLIVLVLVAFNPSGILYAHKILPDIIFSFVFLLFVLFLVRSYHELSITRAAITGICACILALCRGNGVYLIYLMPIMIGLGCRIISKTIPVRQIIQLCSVSFGVAILGMAPWLIFNWVKHHDLMINSEEYVNYAIHDNMLRFEYLGKRLSIEEARESVLAKARKHAGITESEWQGKTINNHKLVATYAKDILSDYPPKLIIYTAVRAMGYLILDPGYKNFINHLDIQRLNIDKEKLSTKVSMREFFSEVFFSYRLTLKVYALLLITFLVLRLLGLVGFVVAIKQKNWELIMIGGGLVLYSTLIVGLIGFARYRLPIDPILILWAVYGGQNISQYLRKAHS